MHPILRHKGRLGIYVAAWAPAAGLIAIVSVLAGGSPWLEACLIALPMAAVGAFASLAAWYPCRALPLGSTGPLRLLGAHLLNAMVSTALWVLAGRGAAALLSGAPSFEGAEARFVRQSWILSAVGILIFLLAAAVHYLIIAFESARLAERKALEMSVLAREAELTALRQQINPHFLFNSLNAISSLAGSDPEGARRMCLDLADLLRRSLKLGAEERIPLAEELSLAMSFLSVERVRFGARLGIEERVGQDAGACLVPPLLLQPLVENAITHGIAHVVSGGVVRIEARRRDGRLEIAVENPLDPEAPRRPARGLGLDNVRRRLSVLYGSDARLEVRRSEASFRVEVSLPASGGS